MEKYLSMLKNENLTKEEFLPEWKRFKNDLNTGKVRTAYQEDNGKWKVNTWVKQFILLGFKFGEIIQFDDGAIDKDTLGERKILLSEKVRKASKTVSVRDGVYLGKGVTFMPPSYANIGAYIDEGMYILELE